ncbi:PREDICTED: cytochrome P450 2U1-like [Priapulus caudatus]|uniref:Cytochrome P450 2U1-like n=1 Tax=Priapulus caudatus TaxID=37621 RepID=A0ABM1E4A7_PRICU|nr:PREDICTED: cytochrome P450 2U1-like [Priapulus caudatus]
MNSRWSKSAMSAAADLLGWLDASTLLVLAVSFLLAYRWLRFPRNLPPGPAGAPLIGYVPWLGKHPYLTFTELTRTYGDVFTCWFGPVPVIAVNGFEATQELLVTRGHDFMDRPIANAMAVILESDKGIVFNPYGDKWRKLRRLTLSALRDFGMGKASLEEKVLEEMEAVTEEFMATQAKPFNPKRIFKNAASNVICSINFGSRYQYTDPKFQQLLDFNDFFFSQPVQGGIETFLPFLAPLFLRIPGSRFHKLLAGSKQLEGFINEIIEEHRNSYDESNIRDFIDIFLKYTMDAEKESPNMKECEFTTDNLFHMIMDVFGAGTETTATSFAWLFLYMTAFPDVQRKVQQEIDEVIGQGRRPCLKDRERLVYMDAVVRVQRHATCTIHSPHRAVEDTTFRNYNVPRAAMIMVNLWSVHRDGRYWRPTIYPDAG